MLSVMFSVFRELNKARHIPGCTAKGCSYGDKTFDLESRGNGVSIGQTHKCRLVSAQLICGVCFTYAKNTIAQDKAPINCRRLTVIRN